MESFGHVLYPLGLAQSSFDRQPTHAPIEPLYLTPIFLTILFSKTKWPSTYFSAAGFLSILSKFFSVI